MFTRLKQYLQLFAYIYPCLLVFTYVHSCLPMFNTVYMCMYIYHCLLCLNLLTFGVLLKPGAGVGDVFA